MEEYSLSKKNIVEHLWTLSIAIIIFVVGVLYGNYRLGDEYIVLIIILSFAVVLLFTIPTLVLHFQYYTIDKSTKLIFDTFNGMVTYTKKGNTIKFKLDEIKQLVRVKGREYAEGRSSFLPLGLFNYSTIQLNDETRIIITSYVVIDLILPIDKNKIGLTKVFYPLIVGRNEYL